MSIFRIPARRNVLRDTAPYLRASQKRWAQVNDVRFVATHRKADNVLEKYKEKLDRKAKE